MYSRTGQLGRPGFGVRQNGGCAFVLAVGGGVSDEFAGSELTGVGMRDAQGRLY
jgi:hypothetical protein